MAKATRNPIRRLTYVSRSTLPSHSANSIHVMKMANAFQGLGIDTTLIGHPAGRERPDEAALRAHYGTEADFRILRLPVNWRRRRGQLSYAGRALLAAWRGGSDLVYTRCVWTAALAARLGRPSVLELHHPMRADSDDNRLVADFTRRRAALGIVAITDALRQRLCEDYGLTQDFIVVAPDGADAGPEPEFGSNSDRAPERLRVVLLGNLYPGKGMETVHDLAPHAPWAEFTVIGGTDALLDEWRARTQEIPNIRFAGRVPHAEVAGRLRAQDVALLPLGERVGTSAGGALDIARWTSPLKAFEYMAAGLPIIASDRPVLREVLKGGANALLCRHDAVVDWVGALQRLREEPGLRKRLGKAGRRDLVTLYSWEARASRLAAIFGGERVMPAE